MTPLWLMAAYGFVAGLPLPLSGFTFRLWLAEGGVSLAMIGVAALIGLGLAITLLAPEPEPMERHEAPAGFASRLAHAVIAPLCDFASRRGALLILAFVALFKLGEAMAGIMTAPFYRALGFS